MMEKKILIIDDETGFTDTIKMRLEARGYRVFAAPDGISGLEMAKKKNPDIILLDLVMAKMNGFLVLSELKKDPYTSAIPVIILTAKTELDYAFDADALGADSYLSKPVKIQELEDVLRKYI
jgi:DNA-binding response OmpR family regulator